MPFKRLLILIGLLAFLASFVQLGLLSLAFEKLGLSRESAFLLLVTTLAGSFINLPLFSISAPWMPTELPPPLQRLFRFEHPPFGSRTVVVVNVGGCVTPVAFCMYLLAHAPVAAADVALAVAAVAAVAYATSRPVEGLGIGMPLLVAPCTAALMALALDPGNTAVLAYVAGTLGVLLGADVLRFGDIRKLGAPVAAVGGAGTFDAIFLTGIIAVLLA
ncbi:MAG: DUF1614 domain-containing protein [Rhodocyclaceae bacterium]